jgi:hypothetical protein
VDDAFISLRYSKRLLQGKGLTWTDGERVEGYTNFLWTVLIAAIGLVTPLSLLDVARVLGMVSMSAALIVVLLANRPRTVEEGIPSLAIGLTLAISGPIVAWSTGGLEQALLGALVVTGIVLMLPLLERDDLAFRDVLPSAAAFALAVLTRPDACLFTASAAAGLVIARRFRARAFYSAAKLVILPLAVFCAHTVARKLYYDSWLPNTFHAKVALTIERVRAGVDYVFQEPSPAALLPPLTLALIAAVLDEKRRKRVVFIALALLVWVPYVIVIGGDVEPEKRHMVLVFLLLALLDLEGLAHFVTRARRRGPAIAYAVALATLVLAGVQWHRDPHRAMATTAPWERAGIPVGRFLKRAFERSDALLAVDAAGATPYYAELDAIDMLGLNDRYLAEHPPAFFGRVSLGHELGDGAYLLRRKPDLILFHVPPGIWDAVWTGGTQMVSTQEFRDSYTRVRFWTEGARPYLAHLWARQEDSRIGIKRDPTGVTVPGFLFSGGDDLAAALDTGGLLVTLIPERKPASLDVALTPGTWQLQVDSTGPLEPPLLTSVGTSPGGRAEVTLDQPSKVHVELRAGSAMVFLRSLRFARLSPPS